MDFISLEAGNPILGIAFTVLTGVAVLSYLGYLLIMRSKLSVESALMPLIGVTVLAFIASDQLSPNSPIASGARTEKIQQAVEESYGLKLSPEDVWSLEYPETAPAKDVEVFGSIQESAEKDEAGKVLKSEISLLWVDGKMTLASPGETGVELEPLKLKS